MSKAKRWLYNMEVNFGPEMARSGKDADAFSLLVSDRLMRALREMEAEGAIPAGCNFEVSAWRVEWDPTDEAHLAVDMADERTIGSAVASLKSAGYSEEDVASMYNIPLAAVQGASGKGEGVGNQG